MMRGRPGGRGNAEKQKGQIVEGDGTKEVRWRTLPGREGTYRLKIRDKKETRMKRRRIADETQRSESKRSARATRSYNNGKRRRR
jgi:hypothetical protein